MRGIIMHDNGRLKTGRVSLLFFIGLVLGLGLLFQLHKPVDEAVVVVRHIFAATPENQTEKPLPQESEAPITKPQSEPLKVAQKSLAKVLEENAAKNTELPPKPIPLQADASLKDDSQKGEPVTDNKVQGSVKAVAEIAQPAPQKKIEKDTVQISKNQPLKSPSQDPQAEAETTKIAGSESSPDVPVKNLQETTTKKPEKLVPEELVIDYQQVFSESAATQNPTVSLMSEVARQRIRDNFSTDNSPTAPARKSQFTALQITSEKKMETEIKTEKRVEQTLFKSTTAKNSSANKLMQNQGITVEKQEYVALHRAWREVGEGKREDDRIIPLRIENLRSAYNFLQMKAVVIMPDKSCIDLSDGSRIPNASLDRFSSTVMQVDDPWQKWGVELRRAGLRPGQSFEMRYYLYDFVKRSIYARVNQAYKWSLNRGLLKAGTKPADVDVLGRAYVVERSGGGSFGVFVPFSLATREGRIIDIDPVCFNNAPDVAALHAAGVI